MGYSFLDTSVEYLKGVGPKRAESLRSELGIYTYGDLLSYYPFRYIDKSRFYKVAEINSDSSYVQMKGKITRLKEVGEGRGKRITAWLRDDTGEMELIWFKGLRWIKGQIVSGMEYVVFGKPSYFNGRYNMAHPDLEPAQNAEKFIGPTLYPVYSTTEKLKNKGFSPKGFGKIMQNLVVAIHKGVPETLSDTILKSLRLMPREEAFRNIHFPKDAQHLKKAINRLKFEELFFIQLRLLRQKLVRQSHVQGHRFGVVGDFFNDFYRDHLPFPLTQAQKRVIREIRTDVGSGKQMNRLLQGDVGSGKTIVALMCMLIALDNGFQASLMAPTEILATQHYESLTELTKGMGIQIELLTGSTRVAKRRKIHAALESGELHLLIGTHALLEDKVQFKNLGFVVIDEQHRFGVAQRARLWKKNTVPPHVLVMTATPIPRTLSMTLYGDLDVSVIDELPPGRKPVQTLHYYDSKRLRVFGFMRDQIKQGRQIYVVYPLIKESEKLDLKDLMDGYNSIIRDFPQPQYQVSVVHGKMKAADKDYEMQRFVNGETQIMVATTVIEVGVNVPNASVMVIENAERFGLSQLHQLRGRVGRGADQSFCILMSGYKLTGEGKKRLETMVRTADGFEIAEVDLELRGPGDMEGTRQSGILDLKLADIVKDGPMLKYARNLAIGLLEDDPQLMQPENQRIAVYLQNLTRNRVNWSQIS